MYNRYIRNDRGTYTRVPEDEPHRSPPPPNSGSGGGRPDGGRPNGPPPNSAPPPPPPPKDADGDVIQRTLRRLLDRFHLESVDTGDLLLLILLFLLFEEDADEELLFALGLLLIL